MADTNIPQGETRGELHRVVTQEVNLVADGIACVDLFCGAGGLTHGLLSAGINVVAGVDIDKSCRYPYEHNNAGANFYKQDIAKTDSDEVESWFGTAPIRVLAGCAPCQPFSSYAQRYYLKGTQRWGLINHFSRITKAVRPVIVTMENVPAVNQHSAFKDFIAELRRIGYYVWHGVVDCTGYGLPQRRRRTVILASLCGPISIIPPSTYPARTVREVLADLPRIGNGCSDKSDPLHCASKLSILNLQRIQASAAGGSWRDWPEELIVACHQRHTGKTYPGVYGRMEWDQPSPTLTTQFYGFGNGRFGHPEQDRALSLREGAILQGFPKSYSFIHPEDTIYFKVLGRLIGNAVPVDLGRVIGESILSHLSK